MEINKLQNVRPAEEPDQSATVFQTNKRGGLFIFAAVLLVVVVLAALYLSFLRSAIGNQVQQLDDGNRDLQLQVDSFKGQKLQSAQNSKQWLSNIQKAEIQWSKVIKSVQDVLPVDPLTQRPKVKFMSYSGATGGKLTLNAQTNEGLVNPFADVSDLLHTFNNSPYFKDAYIPSITRGVTETGNVVLNFSLFLTYSEQLPDALPIKASNEQVTPKVEPAPAVNATQAPANTNPAASVKVPRAQTNN